MRRQRTTRLLLACGALGAPLFVLVFLVDGATRPGYDPAYHPVSALSLGDRGWVQIANFIVTGLLLLGFAAGLRRALRPGPGDLWGPLVVGGFALALVLSGVFVMDPMRGYPPGTPAGATAGATAGAAADPSWHHVLHDIAGVVVFVTLPVAAFILARRFAAGPARPGWVAYSVATGVLAVALLVLFGVAWEADHPATGLVQRAMIVVGWTWITLLALRLRADQPPPRTA